MNHSFDVDMAVAHGVHAAVLHQTIAFWVLKNKANGKHLHDGRHWTYNSAKAFTELFPYLSADQIQRNLKKLEEAGLVVVGCFNTSPYDRTRWYSTAEGVVIDSAKSRNEFPQDCGTYTSSNQVHTSSSSLTTFEKDAPKKPKASKRCPQDFTPSEELVAWVLSDCPGVNWTRETASFKDWEFKTARSDWPATWRSWMRKAADRVQQSGLSRQQTKTSRHTGFETTNYRDGISDDGSF